MSSEELRQPEEDESLLMDQFQDYFSNLFLLFGAKIKLSDIVIFVMEIDSSKDPARLALHIIHLLNKSLMKAAVDTEDVTPEQNRKIEALLTSAPQLFRQFTPDPEYLDLSSRFLQDMI